MFLQEDNLEQQMNKLNSISLHITECLANHEEIDDVFSKLTPDQQIVQLRIFLKAYLSYINQVITDRLNTTFGAEWKTNKTSFVISLEKNLLDNVFGSKKDVKKLLFESGILQESNDHIKAQIITRGEGIFPEIQQITNLNLELKKYFILAQLNETYIQLTLHQVVKTISLTESEATIIVHDQIIYIENVIDRACKELWNCLWLNNGIDFCPLHNENREKQLGLCSLDNTEKILTSLKTCLTEIVSTKIIVFK